MNESPASSPDRSWSLRNRLISLVGLAIAAAWLTGAVAVYMAVSEESAKLFDQRLIEIAELLMSYADLEIDTARREGQFVSHVEDTPGDSRYLHQIWSEKHELLLRSSDAPSVEPMAPLDRLDFDTRIVNGEPMRTYVQLSADGDEVIVVAEPLKFRQTFVGTFHTKFLLTLLASLPLLLAGTWWMLRRALRSVGEAADQMVTRSPANLGPIEVRSPPDELRPMLKSANDLLARFAKALDAEHRLTAAAAHELRTPLAAVKMQAQVALRARTRAELTDALHSLEQCVDRASRMLEQLLTLARLEAMIEPQAQRVMVQLDAVTAGVLQDLTPLLRKRRVRITTALAPANVKGIEFGLAVLMRNLIDNAARHSPPGSAVQIETGEDAAHTFAMVRDSGPGIPESERERVFERFYRPVNSNSDGTGIGLSIVQTVLSVHHAQIHLCDAEEGGLCACVRFPKEDFPTSGVGSHPINLTEKLSIY
jgi:signal transduction histidine kinase